MARGITKRHTVNFNYAFFRIGRTKVKIILNMFKKECGFFLTQTFERMYGKLFIFMQIWA